METFTRIDRTEAALAVASAVGITLAGFVDMPWAVFVAAAALAALFAAVMHWLTRRDRHRRHVADPAAGRPAAAPPDPRARRRRRRR